MKLHANRRADTSNSLCEPTYLWKRHICWRLILHGRRQRLQLQDKYTKCNLTTREKVPLLTIIVVTQTNAIATNIYNLFYVSLNSTNETVMKVSKIHVHVISF